MQLCPERARFDAKQRGSHMRKTAIAIASLVALIAVPGTAFALKKSTVVGAGTGAAAGAVVGGPVGAAVGGVAGGVIGSKMHRRRGSMAGRRHR